MKSKTSNSDDSPRKPTPAELGYRWPAEWEPHAATWVSWPHNKNSWPGKFEPVPAQFANFVRTIAGVEPVHILAGGETVMDQARRLVGDVPNIMLHDIRTNDAWCRDHGPTFLIGPPADPPALIDWEYNAWGGKYPPYDLDNAVPFQIAQLQSRRRFVPGIVLEGGAIEGNGCGTLLTTESCLLNPNRNSGLFRSFLEQYLRDYLGVRHILWLADTELAGDDTDGHIDQLARFVNPSTVVAASEQNAADANYESLQVVQRQLQKMTDQDGRPLQIVTLPMPQPKYVGEQRLPASYLNFYIANGLVAVPQYDDPADSVAVEILAQLFPDRRVCGLPSLDLIWGLGSFHCLTQQEPAWYGVIDSIEA
jgi:agmatine deiminase